MSKIVFEYRPRAGGREYSTRTMLGVGMCVRIIEGPCNLDGNHSYHGKYIGCTGKIVRIPDIPLTDEPELPLITVGVLIDGIYNERSQYGCFWFKPEELTVITEMEEANMLLLKGYKTVCVDVEGFGDQYVASYETELTVNDHVVVTNGDKFICGKVISTEALTSVRPKFQIVSTFPLSGYFDRCDKAVRAKELEEKLNAAVADYQKIALFEMMAEKSPVIAVLLKELKEITGA